MTTNPSALDAVTSHSPASSPELPKLPIGEIDVYFNGHRTDPAFTADQMNAHYLKGYEAGSAAAAQAAKQVPAGFVLPLAKITEDMHVAAVKVLHRASGVDGLPQRMLNAMIAAAPSTTDLVAHETPNASDNGACVQPASPQGWREAFARARKGLDDATPSAFDNSGYRDYTAIVLDALEDEIAALAATPASPQAPAPQAVVGEASDEHLDALAEQWSDGPAITLNWSYDGAPIKGWKFIAERFRCAIRAALTSPAPSAAPHQGADALREVPAETLSRWRKWCLGYEWPKVQDWDSHNVFLAIADEIRTKYEEPFAQHQAPQQGEQL